MQTKYTAPPGSTVMVGGAEVPQGMNWSAVTFSVAVAPVGVRVPESVGDTLTAPPESLATVTDQSTSQSRLPLALRSICAPAPSGTSTSRSGSAAVPPCGYSESVPGVGVGVGVGDGVGLAVVGVGLAVVGVGLAVAGVGAAVVNVDFWPGLADVGAVGVGAVGADDVACVVGLGCVCLAASEVMAVAGTTGGFGSAADLEVPLLSVSAKATAAMATATTTAAATVAWPRGEERSALHPARVAALPGPACTGLGNPLWLNAPARLSTAARCATAPARGRWRS